MNRTTSLKRAIYLGGKMLTGSRFGRNLAHMQKWERADWEENRSMQNVMLQRLLDQAARQVPYYRQLFTQMGAIRFDDTFHLDAFSDIPLLTREQLRTNHASLLSLDIAKRSRIRQFPSGGTTGNPVQPYADQIDWDWRLAQIWLHYSWIGLEPGQPYFYYWAAPQDIFASEQGIRNRFWVRNIQNRKVLNCRLLSEPIMRRHLELINEEPSRRLMIACAQELYELACFAKAENITVPQPFEGILTTATTLTEEMRDTIASVFGASPLSRYGSREVGDVACECAFQTGFHINPMYSKVEVVDDAGRPLPHGEEGRIVITQLHNGLMPLIRYEIGDTGILSEFVSCTCGRSWETLSQLTGRLNEYLALPDGSRFNKVFFHYVMEPLNYLRGYQVHHLSPRKIEIRLLSYEPDYLQRFATAIDEARERLSHALAGQMDITFAQVDELDTAASGKRLLIVKHFEEEQNPSFVPSSLGMDDLMVTEPVS